MRKIQEEEAKKRLTELLDEVERGESIAITRDGKKFAALVPVEDDRVRFLAAHYPTPRAVNQTYGIAVRLQRGDEIFREDG